MNMSIVVQSEEFWTVRRGEKALVSLFWLALIFASGPQRLMAAQETQAPALPYTQQPPEQLQQLVAPIALYPDSLVSQILAASTYPEQVVEADRWAQAHPELKGDALGQAVDQQPWDPSVKALTAFPSVLGNMDKNLSWTSSLGDAYFNQQSDVMDAIQFMRQRAQEAGNLKSTQQQIVVAQGPDIDIEPADPAVVYIPAYDPWIVYGYPVEEWPGWYPYPGIWFGGPNLSFGFGFGIGWYGGFGWGWNHWGFDWHNRNVMYDHGRYYSHSSTFYNRNNFYHGGGERGGAVGNRGGAFGDRGGTYNQPRNTPRPSAGDTRADRGYAEPRGETGVRTNTFSGYDHGGEEKSYSSRGGASLGGGGGGARGGEGGHSGGGGRR